MRKPRTPPDNFPYTDERVPFLIFHNGVLLTACTLKEKADLIHQMYSLPPGTFRTPLYAVWPGQSRSDSFILDRDKARQAVNEAVEKAATDATPQPQ